jgi:hypothetical protein
MPFDEKDLSEWCNNKADDMESDKYKFHKSLAKYYIKWFQDCHDSAIYCREKNDEAKAREYLDHASTYLTIIMENWEAIEFFSIDDNAFKYDAVLPKQFRGYE